MAGSCKDPRGAEARAARLRWCACLVPLLLHQAARADGELTPRQFLSDLRAGVERLQEASTHVQLGGTLTASASRETVTKLSYASNGPAEKLDYTPVIEHGFLNRIILRVGGRDYLLRRDAPDAPFYLESAAANETYLTRQRRSVVNASFGLGMVNLAEIADQMKVSKVSTIPRGSEHLVRADFTHASADPAKPSTAGWIVVDPRRSWALREFEVTQVGPRYPRTVTRATIRYVDGPGLPRCKEMVREAAINLGGNVQVHRYRFDADHWSYEPLPAKAFTLAAYGLGDFGGAPSGKTFGWPYLALGAAAAAVLLGVLLRRRSERHRKAATASGS